MFQRINYERIRRNFKYTNRHFQTQVPYSTRKPISSLTKYLIMLSDQNPFNEKYILRQRKVTSTDYYEQEHTYTLLSTYFHNF